MKKILLTILAITIGLSAKTVTGKLLWAQMEESVIPMISIKVKGKELYFGYKGKEDINKIDKKKGAMVQAYINKNKDVTKLTFINSKKKSSLPFIGKRRTKDGSTKIEIYKNGKIKINSKFKNGYHAKYYGKYHKENINEDSDIPMHGWKVSKNKVCQGYRKAWNCEKLYKK